MTTHLFTLQGCTDRSADEVEVAICEEPDMTCTRVWNPRRSKWLASVMMDEELSRDEREEAVNSAIAYLGVTAKELAVHNEARVTPLEALDARCRDRELID